MKTCERAPTYAVTPRVEAGDEPGRSMPIPGLHREVHRTAAGFPVALLRVRVHPTSARGNR